MLFPSHPNSLGFGFVYARLWDEYAFPFSSQLSTIWLCVWEDKSWMIRVRYIYSVVPWNIVYKIIVVRSKGQRVIKRHQSDEILCRESEESGALGIILCISFRETRVVRSEARGSHSRRRIWSLGRGICYRFLEVILECLIKIEG